LPSGKAVVWGKEENFSLGGEKEFASLCMAPGVGFELKGVEGEKVGGS